MRDRRNLPREAPTNPPKHKSEARRGGTGTDPGDTHLEVEQTARPSGESSGAPVGPARRRGRGGGEADGGEGRNKVVAGTGLVTVGPLLCSVGDVSSRAALSVFHSEKKVLQ